MNIESIVEARDEARKFIERASEIIKECRENKTAFIGGSKKAAGLRRQSMELTRALAKMRRAEP